MTYVLLLLLVCGCGLDESGMVSGNASPIEFTSSKMRIITKAGDEALQFSDGTRFRMFAVQNVNGRSDWSESCTKFYGLEGVGDAEGNINYSIDASGRKASYDVGRNLDFYGVTYGMSENVEVTGVPGKSPVISLSDGCFPDLMYSDNLKNKNSSSGVLNMEFRHALTRLRFEVLKQDESEDVKKELEKVVLKKVVLCGVASSADFNLNTAEWSYSSTGSVTVYENGDGLKVNTEAAMLQNDGQDIELIVVPNSSELYLYVTVDIDGDSSTNDDRLVKYKLMASDESFLKLEQNHVYTLSIVILKNDFRVVAVTPNVYVWVDVDLESTTYFGQPVYFGGLMWMDRNVGAMSADCENDWYNTLGYYYQFGRNIPYIFDVKSFHASNGLLGFELTSGRATDPDAVYTMRNIYTYDADGNKVSTVKHANHSSGACLYGNVAINPGDQGDYSFIRGFIYKNSKGVNVLNNKSWAKQNLDFVDSDDSKVVGDFDNHTYWQTIENQPCPKGWRLPAKSDMFSFMPESTKLFWLDVYTKGDVLNKVYDTNGDGKLNTDDKNQANFVKGSKNAAGEVYEWKYFAGMFKVDPDVDGSEPYSYPVKDDFGRVYGIKYEGEDKAYRVMVEQRASKSGSKRYYVRISRFQTESADRFEMNKEGTCWNLHQFDWDVPVEYMDIPLAGFLYESGMSDFGGGTILRAVEGDGNGTNWTLYLRSGHNGIAVGGNSRRNLGENIRCVRDINAK